MGDGLAKLLWADICFFFIKICVRLQYFCNDRRCDSRCLRAYLLHFGSKQRTLRLRPIWSSEGESRGERRLEPLGHKVTSVEGPIVWRLDITVVAGLGLHITWIKLQEVYEDSMDHRDHNL